MNFLRVIGNLLRFDRANWKAVVLCILAATTFWLFNAFNKNHTTSIKFPLRFEYDQERFIPASALPDQVNMHVSGNGWDLFRNQLGLKLPELTIALEHPLEVKKIVASSLQSMFQPQVGKLRINFLVTDTLRIQIDEKDFHKYKVVVDLSNFTFKKGYGRISPVVVLPDSITLDGPKSVLHNLPDMLSIIIEGNSVDQNFNDDMEVVVTGESITRNPSVVKVMFEVGPVIDVKKRLPLTSKMKNFVLPDSVDAWFRIPARREEDFKEWAKEMSAILPSGKVGSYEMNMPRISKLPLYSQLIKIDSVKMTPSVK